MTTLLIALLLLFGHQQPSLAGGEGTCKVQQPSGKGGM